MQDKVPIAQSIGKSVSKSVKDTQIQKFWVSMGTEKDPMKGGYKGFRGDSSHKPTSELKSIEKLALNEDVEALIAKYKHIQQTVAYANALSDLSQQCKDNDDIMSALLTLDDGEDTETYWWSYSMYMMMHCLEFRDELLERLGREDFVQKLYAAQVKAAEDGNGDGDIDIEAFCKVCWNGAETFRLLTGSLGVRCCEERR